MKTKLITTIKKNVLLVDGLPEKEIKEFFENGKVVASDFNFDGVDGNWNLLGKLKDLTEEDCEPLVDKQIICFVCGGDGKETCTNPDHGFIGYGSPLSFLGANESRCPCCGFDEHHKVPKGGDCECCNGSGLLSESEYEEKADEYGFDDDRNEKSKKESFLSALEAEGLHLNGNPISKNIGFAGNVSELEIEIVLQKQKRKWQEAEENVFSIETLVFVEQ